MAEQNYLISSTEKFGDKKALIKEAVDKFTSGEWSDEEVIVFLRENRELITEFCLRVNEAYRAGDNTGVIKLSLIIEKLL